MFEKLLDIIIEALKSSAIKKYYLIIIVALCVGYILLDFLGPDHIVSFFTNYYDQKYLTSPLHKKILNFTVILVAISMLMAGLMETHLADIYNVKPEPPKFILYFLNSMVLILLITAVS